MASMSMGAAKELVALRANMMSARGSASLFIFFSSTAASLLLPFYILDPGAQLKLPQALWQDCRRKADWPFFLRIRFLLPGRPPEGPVFCFPCRGSQKPPDAQGCPQACSLRFS